MAAALQQREEDAGRAADECADDAGQKRVQPVAGGLEGLFDPGDGPGGMLRGHLARGNPQWREIEDDWKAGRVTGRWS